ncbi:MULTISPECIES: hypothetical protein [unclassified Acidovorax]|nr:MULTISPECIES: hypothetical protein [unclassified Acidovorax]
MTTDNIDTEPVIAQACEGLVNQLQKSRQLDTSSVVHRVMLKAFYGMFSH